MRTSTSMVRKVVQAAFLTFILTPFTSICSFAQISFNDEEGNSRKIRREAKRYKAEDVKDSHLDMDNYSYKKGKAGPRKLTEEMETSVIYHGPNPIISEKKSNKKKR